MPPRLSVSYASRSVGPLLTGFLFPTPRHEGPPRGAAAPPRRRLGPLRVDPPAGGRWRIGRAADPAAAIRQDVLAFAQLSSERVGVADVLPGVDLHREVALARRALGRTAILY